jgi:hypothetical protein
LDSERILGSVLDQVVQFVSKKKFVLNPSLFLEMSLNPPWALADIRDKKQEALVLFFKIKIQMYKDVCSCLF